MRSPDGSMNGNSNKSAILYVAVVGQEICSARVTVFADSLDHAKEAHRAGQ